MTPSPPPPACAWRWKWTDDGIYVSAANGPALYGRDGSLIATQEPPEEISGEEKKLVESMTKFMSSMVDDDKE